MRNGSSGHDERGWSPARHPYSGRGPQPQREDVPFGPEVSWPNGFRQVDHDGPQARFDSGEYRQLVESSYAQDGYQADPRSAGHHPGYQQPPAYQQPAMDDYGYGDPGYADPSYDGNGGYYAGPPAPGPGPARPIAPASGPVTPGGPVTPVPGAYHSAPPAYEPAPPQYDAPPAAFQLPPGSSMAPDPVYPVTGAQEIYRDPGEARHPGYPGYSAESSHAEPGYAGPRYDEPHYGDTRYGDDQRSGEPAYDDQRYADPRQSDPRLEGLRYDELRYDDADSGNDPDYDQSRFDEPLDDEAWFAELRRGGPAFGPKSGGPAGQGPGNGGGPVGNGPGGGPAGNGGFAGFQSAPTYDQSPGYAPGNGNANGGGNGGGAGSAPRMSVVPGKGQGAPGTPMGPSRASVAVQPGLAYQTAPAFPHAPAFPQGPAGFLHGPAEGNGSGFARQPQVGPGLAGPGFAGPGFASPGFVGPGPAPMAALPPGPVGVLTPPVGSRFNARTDAPQARPFAAPAPAGPPPGSGPMPTMPGPNAMPAPDAMVGPDTVAWEMTAEVDELEVIEEYDWDEAEGDGGYAALLHDLETDPEPRDYLRDTGPQPTVRTDTRRIDPRKIDPRRMGRRRGGSNDHRLWLGLGGVVVVAAAAIFGIIKLEFPPGGPSHQLVTPARVASYQWNPALEKKSGLPALRNEFGKMLNGQVVSREYESGAAPGASSPEIVMYLGGHLANQSPANSLANFQQEFKNAVQVNAGPMGGDAACVETAVGTTNSVALCAWFDDDSVGVVDSPTMTTSQLASVMLQFRPAVELTKK